MAAGGSCAVFLLGRRMRARPGSAWSPAAEAVAGGARHGRGCLRRRALLLRLLALLALLRMLLLLLLRSQVPGLVHRALRALQVLRVAACSACTRAPQHTQPVSCACLL